MGNSERAVSTFEAIALVVKEPEVVLHEADQPAHEPVELLLLLQEVVSRGLDGLLLQGQVHAFVPAVLLWLARLDALDADTPHGTCEPHVRTRIRLGQVHF